MTARYMLDTDSVSFALRGQGRVAARILGHRPSELCISSITLAELRYGADKHKSRKLHHLIDTFVASVTVAAFDEMAASQFGHLASKLALRGIPLGEFDALIAAHAISLNLTLVTNNMKHFDRIASLSCENWL